MTDRRERVALALEQANRDWEGDGSWIDQLADAVLAELEDELMPRFSESVTAIHSMRCDGKWTVCVEVDEVNEIWIQGQGSIPAAIRAALAGEDDR